MKSMTMVLLLGVLSWSAVAQPKLSARLAEANNHLRAKEYTKAVALINEELDVNPEDGLTWMFLGRAHYFAEQFDKAISAFAKTVELGYAVNLNEYNIAACYALAHNEDQAYVHLQRALDAGFSDYDQLGQDADFDSLGRDSSRFMDFVKNVKITTRPCAFDDRYRALDFWIGDWDVVNKGGITIARNTIESTHDGCVLVENWEPIYNTTSGKSYNYFDAANNTWLQHWVGQGGIVSSIRGELQDEGAIVFGGGTRLVNGKKVKTQMTLAPLPEGRVLQRFENLLDGKWVLVSENTYVRRPAEGHPTATN